MTIGESIKMARKKAGLTQKALADKLGIPYQGISQYERGIRNPKLETLERIASALEIPLEDLLSDKVRDQAQSLADRLTRYFEEEYNNPDSENYHSSRIREVFSRENNLQAALEAIMEEVPYEQIWLDPDQPDYILALGMSGLPDSVIEEKLLEIFHGLNHRGKIEALFRMRELEQVGGFRKTTPQSPESALYTSTRDKSQEEVETPQNEPQGQKDKPKQETEEQ